MTRRALAALPRAADGAAIVEFALILPALLTLLLGVVDLGYNQYTNQVLQGAIQRAARDSTLEGATMRQAALDNRVARHVHSVAPTATVTFERKSYASFSKVARAEDFTDINGNGACDAGEPFEDGNDNGTWDRDVGAAGFGGARDAVLYTVTVKYDRLVPISAFIPGQNAQFTLRSQSVLRNQPWDLQGAAKAPTTGNCE